jgi:F-type H+-transporting ATPase subunit delta
MQNPKLADRYAKSLLDLAVEQNNLDVIYNDMVGLEMACRESADLVQLMKSPIVKPSKKESVFNALFTGKVDMLTLKFMNLIVNKGREFFLPEIISAFIGQYKKRNQITDVYLTTAEKLDDNDKASLLEKIKGQLQGQQVDLKTKVDPSLIGGFVLEANNNLFDASILRDLKDIKKQFSENLFIPDIR